MDFYTYWCGIGIVYYCYLLANLLSLRSVIDATAIPIRLPIPCAGAWWTRDRCHCDLCQISAQERAKRLGSSLFHVWDANWIQSHACIASKWPAIRIQ